VKDVLDVGRHERVPVELALDHRQDSRVQIKVVEAPVPAAEPTELWKPASEKENAAVCSYDSGLGDMAQLKAKSAIRMTRVPFPKVFGRVDDARKVACVKLQ
jgi:hypothetical protein